ncbi:MAG: DUF1684 domain-containing protein [Rhodothermales bacterium]|nr:DUF1684 domain-containing protein [Rhodothermales bacterium]MCA0269453.1 DUF1684 domain-containing protein [Bacteroidota bacterium]
MKRLLVVLLPLALVACESKPSLDPYRQELLAERFKRDQDLRSAKTSLLTKPVRERFTALRYFEPNVAWRFRLKMEPGDGDTVRVPLSHGGVEPYVRLGYVRVPVGDSTKRLSVFRPLQGEAVLWLPFTDLTSGVESFGGGRYLYPKPLVGDTLDVDFNRAHNPNCDYNPDAYNCALPPPENRLPVRVEAGEMKSMLVAP